MVSVRQYKMNVFYRRSLARVQVSGEEEPGQAEQDRKHIDQKASAVQSFSSPKSSRPVVTCRELFFEACCVSV